jgi:protein-disulfide isomerase
LFLLNHEFALSKAYLNTFRITVADLDAINIDYPLKDSLVCPMNTKKKYEECLNANKYAKNISAEIELATKLGINGVPGFILAAKAPPDPSKVMGIISLRGALPLEMF